MSCCDQAGLMSIEQALETLLSDVTAQTKVERRPIDQALAYVLAEDIVSAVNVPPTDNSAMDGYAINTSDYSGQALTVSQRIAAGHFPEPLVAGTAARIFTGAVIPEGANAVVMQEQCVEKDGVVTLHENIKVQQNIRPLGQDIATNSVVLEKGSRVRPQDLGLLASVGVAEVLVLSLIHI